MLCCRNVSVEITQSDGSKRIILDCLNLDVLQGEHVVIVGENGAGKSTLFKALSGQYALKSGSITLNGAPLTTLSLRTKAQRIAYVPQDPTAATLASMTILENMVFGSLRGSIPGLSKVHSQDNILWAKQKLSILGMGLEQRLDTPVDTLSGGQRQALSLIMATCQPYEILLLDEITAALDCGSSHMIMKLTERIIRLENKMCLMITHDLDDALCYGDRLCVFKHGTCYTEYSKEEKATLERKDLVNLIS